MSAGELFLGEFIAGSWEFTALAESRDEARRLLIEAWDKHCAEAGSGLEGYIRRYADDLAVVAIRPGLVLRDREPFHGGTTGRDGRDR